VTDGGAERTSVMAKRKAKVRTRKAVRKTRPRAKSATARHAKSRKSAAKSTARRRTSKPKARAGRKPTRKTARAAAPKARRASTKTQKPKPKLSRPSAARPTPAALSRERRQLRDDETIPGAPSTLTFETRASAAESGHQMYQQRAKEHTEGGQRLTGGDVESDWNDAYSSGEETPGGDMSTPDQDVVEEIGRALGVEYEDAEELKGAEKIEGRDRNRWEYDPASAEDYKDRNRRDS
jgi:hypothetical protein